MYDGFCKDCKTTPNLYIRVASKHRISLTRVFCSSDFTINGHDFTNLKLSFLPSFQSSYILLGFPALKRLEVVIHRDINSFTMRDFTIQCNRESRRISFMLFDAHKMNQIIVTQARNKKNHKDVYLIFLHCIEELAAVNSH